jgi:hypothetical protein
MDGQTMVESTATIRQLLASIDARELTFAGDAPLLQGAVLLWIRWPV